MTDQTITPETRKKINVAVAKVVAIRIIAGVATATAGCLIANALSSKLNESDETTEND